eukprot:g41488.t1
MGVLAVYNSIPHQYSIPTTANFQMPFCNSSASFSTRVFAFDNELFIQTHGRAMGTRFVPQYANMFMHKFEQDFFAVQDLRPTLYTRYTDDFFILWTYGKESLKQPHCDINKFHPTIRLTMDYSLESFSFLDTGISIKDGHLNKDRHGNTTDRVPFVIQYFLGAQKQCYVLHSLQHIVDDNEHLAKIFPTPPFLAFKQPPNLKQII